MGKKKIILSKNCWAYFLGKISDVGSDSSTNCDTTTVIITNIVETRFMIQENNSCMDKKASAYLEEADDADPKVKADGGLDDGEGEQQQDLNTTAEKPKNCRQSVRKDREVDCLAWHWPELFNRFVYFLSGQSPNLRKSLNLDRKS